MAYSFAGVAAANSLGVGDYFNAVLRMIKRLAGEAGLPYSTCCHTFRNHRHHDAFAERRYTRSRPGHSVVVLPRLAEVHSAQPDPRVSFYRATESDSEPPPRVTRARRRLIAITDRNRPRKHADLIAGTLAIIIIPSQARSPANSPQHRLFI